MYALLEAKKEIAISLKKAIGKRVTVSPAQLVAPPKSEMGDLAFPCFELAKGLKRNPAEIATEIAAKVEPGKLFKSARAFGPYVNFYFNSTAFTEKVLKDVTRLKHKYGEQTLGKGKKLLVEYAQLNTHKEFHVGHVRNAALGQSIVNLMKVAGFEVVAAIYLGDIGAHVAKVMWALEKFHQGETWAAGERAKKLGAVYTEAVKYIAEHPPAQTEVNEVQRALEAHEEPWQSLWRKTRAWSLEAFEGEFSELLIKPDVTYFESEVEERGKKMVQKMLTDGIAKKSEGAVIVDLEAEGLGVALILKSDGSALYATKDIPLALLKDEQFHADRQLFVVDVRQSLYFQQLFAILKRMGFQKQLAHFSYDMVTLPEGAMSSREGNIVTYETLRDTMVAAFTEETRKRHEDWSERQVRETALKLALGSIKFVMLRQDPQSIITFDMKEAMSFEGFTAPYLLYTIARIESIKTKTKVRAKIDATLLTSPLETRLINQIAELPGVLERAAGNFQVSSIAQWAFETSKKFAEYYHEVQVINEENKDLTAARLALCLAVQTALINALTVLGIEPLLEM